MHRLFVEKKPEFAREAAALRHELRESLGLDSLHGLRILQRYDIDGLDDDAFDTAVRHILSEPQTDEVSDVLELGTSERAFAVEYLPGQFDQRADSAAQCLQILTARERPGIASARVYVIDGPVSDADLARIKDYLINSVDSHEASLALPETLEPEATEPADVASLTGFADRDPAATCRELGLAMSPDDLAFCQKYFAQEEGRDPSITEIRVLDTYWSDHCRHTTFLTRIEDVEFDEHTAPIQRAWATYQQVRADLGRDDKPVTLMDIALLGMRELKASGELDNLEESEEINAASIVVPVTRDLDAAPGIAELLADEGLQTLPEHLARQAREFREAADLARGGEGAGGGRPETGGGDAGQSGTEGTVVPDAHFLALGDPVANHTSEHQVWFDETNQLAIKRTWPGIYGQVPARGASDPAELDRKNADLADYLLRMALHVAVFGSEIEFRGFHTSSGPGLLIGQPAGETSCVIAQKWAIAADPERPLPDWDDIHAYLGSLGFTSVPGSFYGWIRDDGVALIDARPENFILTPEGVVPIDLQLAVLPAPSSTEEWLLQFKNETHNHPTEIEPFGGAATCLGGCIRDPLSGRAYVYQAMRVTGAGDPLTPFADTLPGKLPQKKICRIAADGYSSYGNQIGLATGEVAEVYHPGYVAKRMEIGAVVAAAPRSQVFRGSPAEGDLILLIGGRTGRDGVGGATGSSKEHDDAALENAAEVQKGDAPTERKIQRLFRNPELARRIKVCNDFGAGGVSVAIGEIAPSLDIDLDAVPKKYAGLDGTELAISESQERMAVCVDPADVDYFIAESDRENLECTQVATVAGHGRLRMHWRGHAIVDLARSFLDTNGVQQSAAVRVRGCGFQPQAVPAASSRGTSTEPDEAAHSKPSTFPGLTPGVSSSHESERASSLLERSASPEFRESLGSAAEPILDVLRGVHQAGARSGCGEPSDRAGRLEYERALRTVEERQLRGLNATLFDPDDFDRLWHEQGSVEGAEQRVLLDRNGTRVLKANHGSYHGNWLQYFDRLAFHHSLFPETAYSLEGLLLTDFSVEFVVSQPAFRLFRDESGEPLPVTREQVEVEMASRFGAFRFRNDDYYLPALDLFIEDLHDENVLLAEDGETLLFIDPVLFPRPADMAAPVCGFQPQAVSAASSRGLSTDPDKAALSQSLPARLAELNHASQKGLGEMFDASVGAGTVLWPFGGEHQLTPPDAMVATLPLLKGETDTASFMAWGFDPEVASWSPFHGAAWAVTQSVCKAVAAGARLPDIRLTLQEYFPKLGTDPARWGLPFAALLGAFDAQHHLRLAAIGGKDSMSGSFNELDVPPTLVSFAVAPGSAEKARSPEFKRTGSSLSLIEVPLTDDHLPDYGRLLTTARLLAEHGPRFLAVKALDRAGLGHALATSAFGNRIGVRVTADLDLLAPRPFAFVIEHAEPLPDELGARPIGETTAEPTLTAGGETLTLADLLDAWTATLDPVYPTCVADPPTPDLPDLPASEARPVRESKAAKTARPRVLIPAFPGTNSEYDSARAFVRAGAEPHIEVFRNLTPEALEESLHALAARIAESQILMLPGGFSAGDEPDGSARFITTVLRNPRVADAVMDLLKNRDGLILGICNGFQALVKTGLVPYGEFRTPEAGAPALTHNDIGRHLSVYARTRVASTLSPWLAHSEEGDIHRIPLSHGEGKFIAPEHILRDLARRGQIATRYCDADGRPSMDIAHNPNGSLAAIEGITSPCGRVFGKMGHTERRGPHVARNIPGDKHQPLFTAGVEWFR